jgi:hypothetical protein
MQCMCLFSSKFNTYCSRGEIRIRSPQVLISLGLNTPGCHSQGLAEPVIYGLGDFPLHSPREHISLGCKPLHSRRVHISLGSIPLHSPGEHISQCPLTWISVIFSSRFRPNSPRPILKLATNIKIYKQHWLYKE